VIIALIIVKWEARKIKVNPINNSKKAFLKNYSMSLRMVNQIQTRSYLILVTRVIHQCRRHRNRRKTINRTNLINQRKINLNICQELVWWVHSLTIMRHWQVKLLTHWLATVPVTHHSSESLKRCIRILNTLMIAHAPPKMVSDKKLKAPFKLINLQS